MVLLDREAQPLLPAISWQCHAATEEVAALQNLGVEKTVGKIEPRFVLPKLACVLNRQPELKERLGTVFTPGDWIAHRLTGQRSLSTSDALSNGLLEQQSRKRADKVMEKAGMDVAWFPEAAQSGTVVGTVQPAGDVAADAWQPLREMLAGWQFVAGLGDNHASAVGCGMTDGLAERQRKRALALFGQESELDPDDVAAKVVDSLYRPRVLGTRDSYDHEGNSLLVRRYGYRGEQGV